MTTRKASLLVPGIGYLALGFGTLAFGVLRARPAPGPVGSVPATSLTALALVAVLVAAFYFAMSLCILRQKGRRFVIIGASFSCILIPFGTAIGLIFLLWTRREWTGIAVRAREAELGAAPNGGLATPPGNSGVRSGPPSVS